MRRTSRETIKSRQNIVPSPSVWNYARKGQIPWWWPTDRWVSDSEFLVGSQLPCRCGAAFVVARQRGQMTEKKGTNIKLKGKIALITGGAQGLGKGPISSSATSEPPEACSSAHSVECPFRVIRVGLTER